MKNRIKNLTGHPKVNFKYLGSGSLITSAGTTDSKLVNGEWVTQITKYIR